MGLSASSNISGLLKNYYSDSKLPGDNANLQSYNKNFNRSIFNDNAIKNNPELQNALPGFEANNQDPEASYKFFMEAVKADVKDGALNGDIFKEGTKEEKENLSRLFLSQIFNILVGLDKKDDGTTNGSVFETNAKAVADLDLLDDGIQNGSVNKLISSLKQQNTENTDKADDTEYHNNKTDLKDVYNVFDIYNEDKLVSPRFGDLYKPSTTENKPSDVNNDVKTTPASNAIDGSSIKGGSPTGQNIAKAGIAQANSLNSTGYCYKGVKRALATLGVNVTGGSAYMAADQLASNSKFKEIKISAAELKKLPAGAIVVWGKTDRSPHGHISIALGDGRESSDHIQKQMTSLRGYQNYRVFVPSDMA